MFMHIAAVVIILVGVYALLIKENLIKKVIGLVIFSSGIHMFLISLGYRAPGIAPIMEDLNFYWFAQLSVDPLPQAMVLTSIVINLSVTVVALTLIVMVYRKFGTLDSRKIRGMRG